MLQKDCYDLSNIGDKYLVNLFEYVIAKEFTPDQGSCLYSYTLSRTETSFVY